MFNTKIVIDYLENHPAVAWVSYPGNEDHPDKRLADKYLPKGAGSMVTFGIKGGREAGAKLIDSIRIMVACCQCWGCEEFNHPSCKHHPSAVR